MIKGDFRMECLQCHETWTISDLESRAVKYCPFCGNELQEKEPTKFENISSCFRYLIHKYTATVFDDPQIILSYVSDYFPELKVEKRILKITLEAGINKMIFETEEGALNEDQAIHILVNDYGLADIWAHEAVHWFVDAITERENLNHKLKRDKISLPTCISKNRNLNTMPSGLLIISKDVKEIYESEISMVVPGSDFVNWFRKRSRKHDRIHEMIIKGQGNILPAQFMGDKSFDWLIIGNGVTEIPEKAFQNTAVQLVYISSSVERIGSFAFAGNNARFILIEKNNNRQIADGAFWHMDKTKLAFDMEWNSPLTWFCRCNDIPYEGLGPFHQYFIEYVKRELKEC